MSVQVSYKKQTAFYIILILLLFSATEIMFQIYDPTLNFCRFQDPSIDDETRVLICKAHNAMHIDDKKSEVKSVNAESIMRINNQGFRGEDFDEEKNENVFRVITIGGSTTFGSGVKDDQTYSYLLQEIFNRNPEVNVEVINLGIAGGWSYTEIELINEKAINFEPDLIIVYDGWNDVISSKLEQEIDGDWEEMDRTVFHYIDDPASSFLRNFKTFKSINRVITYGDDVFGHYNKTITNYDMSNSDMKINEWVSRWSDACTNLKQNKIETIIIIQPMAGHR